MESLTRARSNGEALICGKGYQRTQWAAGLACRRFPVQSVLFARIAYELLRVLFHTVVALRKVLLLGIGKRRAHIDRSNLVSTNPPRQDFFLAGSSVIIPLTGGVLFEGDGERPGYRLQQAAIRFHRSACASGSSCHRPAQTPPWRPCLPNHHRCKEGLFNLGQILPKAPAGYPTWQLPSGLCRRPPAKQTSAETPAPPVPAPSYCSRNSEKQDNATVTITGIARKTACES